MLSQLEEMRALYSKKNKHCVPLETPRIVDKTYFFLTNWHNNIDLPNNSFLRRTLINDFRDVATVSFGFPPLSNSLYQNQPMTLHDIFTRFNPQITWIFFCPIILYIFKFSSSAVNTNSARWWQKKGRTVFPTTNTT